MLAAPLHAPYRADHGLIIRRLVTVDFVYVVLLEEQHIAQIGAGAGKIPIRADGQRIAVGGEAHEAVPVEGIPKLAGIDLVIGAAAAPQPVSHSVTKSISGTVRAMVTASVWLKAVSSIPAITMESSCTSYSTKLPSNWPFLVPEIVTPSYFLNCTPMPAEAMRT